MVLTDRGRVANTDVSGGRTTPVAAMPLASAGGVPAPPGARRRAWRRFALRLALGLALLTALLLFLPFDQLTDAFARLPLAMFTGAIVVYMALHLIGAAKWRLVVNTAGAGIGMLQAIRFYYAGLFGNTFLPSLIGGDVVRAGLALRHARSKTGLLLGSVLDRAIDIVGLAGVAALGVALIPSALDARSRQVFIGLFVVFGIASLIVLAVGLLLVRRGLSVRARRRIVKLRQAARAVARRPWVVVVALLSGMTLQISLVVLTAWLGRTVGIDASLQVWLFVWPLAKISALVPVTQGGLGVREAAQAALFAPFGVPAVLAVAVSLVFQGVIISGGLIGGLIAFLIGRRATAERAPSIGNEALAANGP